MPAGSDTTKALSSALFTQKHKLDVLCAVAEWPADQPLYARGVADMSGIRENQVGPVLRQLAVAGLITPESRSRGGGQRVHYTREPCLLWDAVLELRDRGPSPPTP